MEKRLAEYKLRIKEIIENNKNVGEIADELEMATKTILIDRVSVADRVDISSYALKLLSKEQRRQLASSLITEQIVKQREALNYWSTITAQSGMIDMGYIAQHLVSLCTQISGQGMRGKGLDLKDGSEVKSANYIDSKDKKDHKEPRWNFNFTSEEKLKEFLHYNFIYLVSLDYSENGNIRIRIWKVDIRKHTALRKRYKEWMESPARDSNNFQLFPPKSGENTIYARHGSNKKGQLRQTKIALENVAGAEKIFHAEVVNNTVEILLFK